MAVQYLEYGVGTTPITGRHLAHNRSSIVERAYLGADLYTRRTRLGGADRAPGGRARARECDLRAPRSQAGRQPFLD